MLKSITIRNYRNIRNLNIDNLGQINLVTGRNNTGKSTLLEAISIYATKADTAWLYSLLDDRGENSRTSSNGKDNLENNIATFSSLFYNRKVSFDALDSMFIGPLDNTLFGIEASKENSVSLRFVRFREDLVNELDEKGQERPFLRKKRTIVENENEISFDYKIGFEISANGYSFLIPLEEEKAVRHSLRDIIPKDNFQFIKTRSVDRDANGKLWDNVTLTEKEEHVINALKIIEHDLERLAFVAKDDSNRQRNAVIKLTSNTKVLPLRSMGDGINRILTIILALVNSDNGYLLIDEFENGLHYSVQESLWELIFKASALFKVQVFATTHSQDCIAAFETVLNKANLNVKGKLIRLESINENVKPIEFDKKELKIASENDIETR